MSIPTITDGRLRKEYASYTRVHHAVVAFCYVSVAALFAYLCKLLMAGHSIIPSSLPACIKEAASIGGIWYLFHMCDTDGGLLRPVHRWKCSLLNRIRREEAIDILRDGGRYFIDECEMTLENDLLAPKQRATKSRT